MQRQFHLAAVLFLVGCGSLYAQIASRADWPRVEVVPERPRRAAPADLRAEANLVIVSVSVTDPKNRPVTGLAKEAFRIFDDKTEQRVAHFSQEDGPISVGIVFDASRSMARKLTQARAAVAEFLRTSNADDEFFLVTFNDQAKLALPFVSNPSEIRNRLMETCAEGHTALLDAISLALDTMKQASRPRKALLVISDGGDNRSRYTERELRQRLREADVAIYAMGIYDGGPVVLPEEERGGPALLNDLAEQSGGRHFPVSDLADLPKSAAQIGLELRNCYLLGYSPDRLLKDGKYHHLQVKLVSQHKLYVTARPGYFAPPL
jgi:VWFA-related protein